VGVQKGDIIVIVQNIFSPASAQQNLINILKQINEEHTPVRIVSPEAPDMEAVLISKTDYEAMLETMELLENGELQIALLRGSHLEGTADISQGVDWDAI
jgi:PHD/YefM family antitoxin component YafN of YafNO toxin-antitoxin module